MYFLVAPSLSADNPLLSLQRDERVLVVWAPSIETIIPTCHDFEDRLIKLLWRTRPPAAATEGVGTASNSISGHSAQPVNPFRTPTPSRYSSTFGFFPPTPGPGLTDTVATPCSDDPEKGAPVVKTKAKRTWYGKKYTVDVDPSAPIPRPTVLYACVYNGLAAGLSLCKSSLLASARIGSDFNLQFLYATVSALSSNRGYLMGTTSASPLLRQFLPSGVSPSSFLSK